MSKTGKNKGKNGVKNKQSSIMATVMSIRRYKFTNTYYKWIGNIEGTKCSLRMELFGSRGNIMVGNRPK